MFYGDLRIKPDGFNLSADFTFVTGVLMSRGARTGVRLGRKEQVLNKIVREALGMRG
jgi:hypothetical protein